MADNPTEQFEKKILFALKATISGMREALTALSTMQKYLSNVEDSTKSVDKAYNKVSKTLNSTRKSIRDYNKSLKLTRRFQRGLFESMRGIGNVARISFGAASAAAAAFLVETKRIGDTMLQFQTSSLQAAGAVDRLRDSYKGLGAESGRSVLSIQDIASQLTEFQRQGIAEMGVSAQTSFIQGFSGITSALARVFGKSGARDLMSEWTGSMTVEFKKFRTSIGGELKDLTTEFEKARAARDDPRSAKIMGDLIEKMKDLRLYTGDLGGVTQRLIASFQTMRDVFLGGGDPLTSSVMKLNEAWATFGTTIETLSTEFVAAFGPHLAKLIDTVGDRINKAIGKGAKSAAEYVADLSKRFGDWGGVPELVKRIEDKLASMYRTLKPIIDYLASLARRFIDADASTKIFAASVAAIAFAPGLAIGLVELTRGFKGLAIWAAQAATASAAIGGRLGGLGAAAAGGLRFGIAGGAGLLAGSVAQAGAGMLGVEQGGLADRGIGVGTAALVGLSFAGPWGAAVAGVSKVLWDSYSTIKSDHEATKNIRAQHEDMVKQGKFMTADFRKKLEEQTKFAVTKAQVAKVKEGELILKKFSMAPDADFSGIERQINAAHQKSIGLEPIKFEIADSYKIKIKDLERRYGEAVAAGDTTVPKNEHDKQINSLKEAGRLESKSLHIRREMAEVEQKFKAGRIADIAHSENMIKFRESLEKTEEKQLNLDIGIDPRSAIANVKSQLKKISDIQEKIKVGIDIDSAKFEEQKRKALDSYADLKSKLGESVPGGQFEEVIAGLDKLQKKVVETRNLQGFELMLSQIRDLSEYSDRTLPGFTAALAGIGTVMDSLGPTTKLFGESLDSIASTGAIDSMQESFQAMEDSALAVKSALKLMATAKTAEDLERAQRAWVDGIAKGIKTSAEAAVLLKTSLDANLKALQKNVELVQLAKNIRQADLDISQQLYGTPALAVQAQLALVKTIQAEKDLLESQLDATMRQHDIAKAMLGTNEDIFLFKEKELALTQLIKQLTADQLRQVKELRDGYLDAVTAQALGASRFSKILITQDQNLGRGLLQGAIKPNFLLGQAGAAAGAAKADPYRFSAQGMGFLESLSGQIMRPEDIAKAVYDRVANISDPLSKASALQSADIFMNIMSGANKNTRDLGSIFMSGMTNLGDRFVDAIGAFAEQRLPRAAAGLAMRGVPAGETLFGAAQERAGRGLTLPPRSTGVGGLSLDDGFEKVANKLKELKLHSKDGGVAMQQLISELESEFKSFKSQQPLGELDIVAYRKQAKEQGASQDSVRALMEYYGQARGAAPATVGAARQIDPGKANVFFGQALLFYSRFEALLAKIAEGVGVDITTIQNITEIKGKTTAPTGFGMSTLSVRGVGQVGLSQAVPGDSGASKQLIDDLRRSDHEVKRHEKAHARVAGPFAEGPPSYTYQKGPDGRRYAVGGEVLVDISPIPGDPQATIDKMRRIRSAALAPRHPSEQDLAVAQHATQIERRIKGTLSLGVLGIEPPESFEIPEEPQAMQIFRKLKDHTEPIISSIPEVEETPQVMKVFRQLKVHTESIIPAKPEVEEPQVMKVFRKLKVHTEPILSSMPEVEEPPQVMRIFRRLKVHTEPIIPAEPIIPGIPETAPQVMRFFQRLKVHTEPIIPAEPIIPGIPEVEEPQVMRVFRRLKGAVPDVPGIEPESPEMPEESQAMKIFKRMRYAQVRISEIADVPDIEEPQVLKTLHPLRRRFLELSSATPEISSLDTHLSPMGLPLGAPPSTVEITNLGKLVNVISQSIKANKGNTSAIVRNITAQSDVSKTLKSGNFFKEVSAELKSTGKRLESAKSVLANTKTTLPSKIDEIINTRSAPGGQKPLYKLGLEGKDPKLLRMKDSSQVAKLQSEVKALRRGKSTGQQAVDMLTKRQARVGKIKDVGRAARAAMPNDYRVRDIFTNLKRVAPSIREGKAAAGTGTRSYQAGRVVRSVPGKVIQTGRAGIEAGKAGVQAVARGAGRTYQFVKELKAADIGKSIVTAGKTARKSIMAAGKTVGKGMSTGAKGTGSILRGGVASSLVLTELAFTAAEAIYEAKQLEKAVELLPDNIARANQDKQGRDLGQKFELLIATSETKTIRDEMVKQRQSLDSMIMGLAPTMEQEGFEYRGQGGIGGIVPKFSMDIGLTGGVPEGTIDAIKKRRVAVQRNIDEYDKDIVAKYDNYVAQLNATVFDMQKASPDADMSELTSQFNKISADMTQFIGDLISNAQGRSLEDISISSNRLIQQGADKLLDSFKSMTNIQMEFDAAPADQKKEIEAELAKASKRVRLGAGLLRSIGGAEAVDKVIDRFSQHMQDQAGAEVVSITKQIDGLMKGVDPRKIPKDIKKQVDQLSKKRATIQIDKDMDIGDELAPDELDLLGPHINALKTQLSSYADLVQKSAIAGPDQRPIIEKQIAIMENSIADQMTRMGHIFGEIPALEHVTETIKESQELANQKFDEQKNQYEQQISKLKSIRVDTAPQFQGQIQSQIDEIQSKINAIPKALTNEFKNIRESASKILVATPEIAKESGAGMGAGKDIAEQAKKYKDVVEHLNSVLGKDIDVGDFNMSQLKSAQNSANTIFEIWQKTNKELDKSGKLHNINKAAMVAGALIVRKLNQAQAEHQSRISQNEQKRQAVIGKQQIIQEEITNIKLPLAETDKLRQLEEKRAQGVKLTREQISKEVPEMAKIADLHQTLTKRDGIRPPERREDQSREDYAREKSAFRAQREAASIEAGITLKDEIGEGFYAFSSNINNLINSMTDTGGTRTPGQFGMGLARVEKALKSKERDSTQLRAEKVGFDAADTFANMSSTMKDVFKTSSKVVSPGQAAGAGGIAGAIQALLSDDKSIGNIINKTLGGAAQATVIKGALGSQLSEKTQEMFRNFSIGGDEEQGARSLYQRLPTRGKSALPGGMPILTAVDTDEFTKPRDFTQELREAYGSRAESMIKRVESIGGIDKRIKQIDQQLEGPATTSTRGPFGTGPKDLHGFEIPGVTTVERRGGGRLKSKPQPLMSVEREERLKHRRRVLSEIREKEKAKFDKIRIAAEEAGGVKQTQFEKLKIERQTQRQQVAAQAALGTSYTGEAPARVMLSTAGPQTPETVRGKQAPIKPRTGVSDPGRVRQLTHGSGGSFANKGRGVKQILQQAGQIIEEMGSEMDRFNEDQDNITQYAGNRLFNVQAISP